MGQGVSPCKGVFGFMALEEFETSKTHLAVATGHIVFPLSSGTGFYHYFTAYVLPYRYRG